MTAVGIAADGVNEASPGAWHKYAVLLRYARPHTRGWLAILGVTVLTTLAALLAPLPLKVLVDHVFGHRPLSPFLEALPGTSDRHVLLVYVVLAELAIFATLAALDVLLTFLWIKVGQTMVYDVARDLFARVQRRSLRDHASQPVGETLQRVASDCWAVHTVVDELLFTPLHVVITIVGLVVVMASLNPALTLLAFAMAPLMAAASLLLGKPVRIAGNRRREVEGELQSHVQQTLAGISVVQAFGAEERQRSRFEELAGAAIRTQVRVTFVGGLNGFGSGLAGTVGVGAILLVGAHQVLAGSLTVGGLIAFLAYAAALQTQFGGFAGIYTKLQGARASTDRVVEVLDARAEVADAPGAVGLKGVGGHVRYERVGFGYDRDRPVLEDVSFEARPGQVVAIVGATGAGKSTLVGLLPRFFDPDTGRVSIDGHDLRSLRVTAVRESVSLVLQESFLFPFSIAENIAYGRPGAGRGEIEAAALAANAHEFIARLPDGYETVVGERGATLSGGERQRVAIARALLKDAPILILDEPTSALDAQTEGLLLEALNRLMAGRTTLIIAHRLSTVRNADHIIVMARGRIIETGTHQQLLDHDGTYARMHGIQHGKRDRLPSNGNAGRPRPARRARLLTLLRSMR